MGYKISSTPYNAGKNTTWLPSCHSTNSYAIQYLKENEVIDGWIFFTFQQTAGRGQAGNKWESQPDKNLTFSKVLIAPDVPVGEQFFLNMVVSLAVRSFLKLHQIEATIKWPNDIYVKDKKVAGILIESSLRADEIRHSVIGIGLNVNQTHFHVANATSMQIITGQEYDLLTAIGELGLLLDEKIALLKKAPAEIVKEYHQLLYRRGIQATYKSTSDGEIFEGVIQGVDIVGRLVIQTSLSKRIFELKEVQFL